MKEYLTVPQDWRGHPKAHTPYHVDFITKQEGDISVRFGFFAGEHDGFRAANAFIADLGLPVSLECPKLARPFNPYEDQGPYPSAYHLMKHHNLLIIPADARASFEARHQAALATERGVAPLEVLAEGSVKQEAERDITPKRQRPPLQAILEEGKAQSPVARAVQFGSFTDMIKSPTRQGAGGISPA